MKILFCQLRTHGDIIRTFPAIELIHRAYPEACLAATCLAGMEETWALLSFLNEIISQPSLQPGTGQGNFVRLTDCSLLEASVTRARELNFDYYFDFQGTFQSALFGALSQIPIRIGHAAHIAKDGAHLFYTEQIQTSTVQSNRMYRHLTVANQIFPNLPKPYFLKRTRESNADILLIPGSSQIGRLKRWPAKSYAQLASALLPLCGQIWVAFGPGEEELQTELQPFLPSGISTILIEKFQDYIDKLFVRCFCVIGNDSAPLHLAVWQDVPTFMILGPTLAPINAPWLFGTGAYIQGHTCLFCDPWRGFCERGHLCMKELTVEAVFKSFCTFFKFF